MGLVWKVENTWSKEQKVLGLGAWGLGVRLMKERLKRRAQPQPLNPSCFRLDVSTLHLSGKSCKSLRSRLGRNVRAKEGMKESDFMRPDGMLAWLSSHILERKAGARGPSGGRNNVRYVSRVSHPCWSACLTKREEGQSGKAKDGLKKQNVEVAEVVSA